MSIRLSRILQKPKMNIWNKIKWWFLGLIGKRPKIKVSSGSFVNPYTNANPLVGKSVIAVKEHLREVLNVEKIAENLVNTNADDPIIKELEKELKDNMDDFLVFKDKEA